MGTNTTKYGLYKPSIAETNWGALVNTSLDDIDKLPLLKKGSDVVSEAALFTTAGFPTDGNHFDITGTTNITSIITSSNIGTVIALHFDAALTITHNSGSLDLPNGRDIITEAGTELLLVEHSAGNWRCIGSNIIGISIVESIVCNDNQVICNDNEVVIN